MTNPSIKQPPHSNEAEQSLLGAVMINPGAWDRVASKITESDFYTEAHRLIWKAICEAKDQGSPADPVTIADWFAKHGKSEIVKGGSYLTALANETPGSNVTGWVRIILAKSKARRLIEIGTDIADRAFGSESADDILAELHQHVSALQADGQLSGPRHLREIAASWVDGLTESMERGGSIKTGLADIDKRWGGMHPTELYIIAARPSMGKTSAMLTICKNVAGQTTPLIFSAEMSGESLYQRLVAGRVDANRMRNPQDLESQDWDAIRVEMARLKKLNMLVDDTGGITCAQLAARARAMKAKHDIGLICVDYLQLVKHKSERRFDEVSEVSRQMKALAKNLKVPVLILSQLSRKVEERVGNRPKLSDLRESGQLEQDADVVTFLYHEGGLTEWITEKHRHGEKGTDLVLFRPHCTDFVNADHRDQAEYWQESKKPKQTSRFSKMAGGQT